MSVSFLLIRRTKLRVFAHLSQADFCYVDLECKLHDFAGNERADQLGPLTSQLCPLSRKPTHPDRARRQKSQLKRVGILWSRCEAEERVDLLIGSKMENAQPSYDISMYDSKERPHLESQPWLRSAPNSDSRTR